MAVQFGNCAFFDLVADGLISAGGANGAVGAFDLARGGCGDKIGFHFVAKRFWPGVDKKDWRLFLPFGQIAIVVFEVGHSPSVFLWRCEIKQKMRKKLLRDWRALGRFEALFEIAQV